MLKGTVIGLSTFIFAAFCAAVVVFAQTPTTSATPTSTVAPTTTVSVSPTVTPSPTGQVQGDKTVPQGAPNTGRGGI